MPIEQIHDSWHFDERQLELLSSYEKAFVRNLLANPLDYYTRRLERIGMSSQKRVLDVACGIGHWTTALSIVNASVCGIDIATDRLMIARSILQTFKCSNVKLSWGDMHAIPYPAHSFSSVFCHGALMFGHIPTVIREFARVLEPGGRVYANLNGFGWYLHLLVDRGIRKGNLAPCLMALKAFLNALMLKKKYIPVTEKNIGNWFDAAGFRVEHIGPNGSMNQRTSNYRVGTLDSYYGFAGVMEVIATKC